MTRHVVVGLALWAALNLSVVASGPELGGYFKSFLTVLDPVSELRPNVGRTVPLEGTANHRVRGKLFWDVSNTVSVKLAYELIPQIRPVTSASQGDVLPRPSGASYRVADLRANLYPFPGDVAGSFVLRQNLDRAWITVAAPFADISVGRQPIAFGSARVVNPTDVIAPFTVNALDTEERTGVDAIRVRAPLGTLSELDVGVILGDGWKASESAAFVRTQLYLIDTDVSVLVLAFRKHPLLGIDLARTIGGAGVWLEAAYADLDADMKGYLRLSTGFDYQYSSRLYASAEFHFNGAGARRTARYLDIAKGPAYREGAVYLLGRYYISPALTYQFTPLFTGTFQPLLNIADGSALVAGTLSYSFAEDVVASAGAFYAIGDAPTPRAGNAPLPKSEFGLYPRLFFTSIRLYF